MLQTLVWLYLTATTVVVVVSSITTTTGDHADRPSTIQCNLVPTTNSDSSVICQLDKQITGPLNLPVANSPLRLDAEANLVWTNRYQPTWTRWSQLCKPTHSSQSVCSNSQDCDSTGTCRLVVGSTHDDELVAVELRDNMDAAAELPKFPDDMRLLNVSWDLDTAVHEILLLDRTDRLDSFRSKPNRMLMRFSLDSAAHLSTSVAAAPSNCKTTVAPGVFDVRFDAHAEKLYLTMLDRRNHEFKKGTFF